MGMIKRLQRAFDFLQILWAVIVIRKAEGMIDDIAGRNREMGYYTT